MTGEQWLASDDPAAMLRHLRVIYEPGPVSEPGVYPTPLISDRKLRLFACACCRQAWHLLTDPRSRRAVEVAEKWADGALAATNLLEARVEAAEVGTPPGWAAHGCCAEQPNPDAPAFWQRCHWLPEQLPAQAALLRDIAGNPFRPVVLPRPLPWIVTNLARAAYEERPGRECRRCGGGGVVDVHGEQYTPGAYGVVDRAPCRDCRGTGRTDDGALDPQRLAVLADALEEAGCTEEAILRHLRSPGPHVRGCWALDLCLGRE